MIVRTLALAAIAAAFVAGAAARADDFSDHLDKARSAYAAHDLRGAQRELGDAEGLIRQFRLKQWKVVLPDALDGWRAENVEGTAAAMAMLGGGVSVSRRYRKDGASVNIEIIADSPIVASVSGVIKMLTAVGAETMTVAGHTVVYRKEDHSMMAIVADKALITVKGSSASEDDLKSYFKAINIAEIEKLLK